MNLFFLKLFSFFIGLFITLFIINYNNIQNKKEENFQLNKLNFETFSNSSKHISVVNNSNIIQNLPHKNYKYMAISTYFDIKQIGNTEGKWYDIDYNPSLSSNININTNINLNQNNYFIFSKMINLKNNKINNNGSKGADLNGIELRGPKSFYYSNNITSNEINEFSMIMSLKINDIKEKNNFIFEMIGNSQEINNTNNIISYTYSIININIQPNDNNNFNFIITIGNNIYAGNINNIDKTIIRNSDILVLGLLYTDTEITFLINKEMYKYKTKKDFVIKLGSENVIINKNGNINMDLYNFTYYKSIIPISEYLHFFKHNYHYLSGLNNVISSSSSAIAEAKKDASIIANKCLEENKETDSIKINKRLDELEKNLGKCFDKNKEKPKIKEDEIKPFDINIVEDIKKTSNNIFSFFFE